MLVPRIAQRHARYLQWTPPAVGLARSSTPRKMSALLARPRHRRSQRLLRAMESRSWKARAQLGTSCSQTQPRSLEYLGCGGQLIEGTKWSAQSKADLAASRGDVCWGFSAGEAGDAS